MIRCEDITVKFGGKSIFENLSVHINRGEHFCIGGESGRGKTTFLNLLQGYVIPEAGSITIDGMPLNPSHIISIRRLMAWIPQNSHLPVDNGWELLKLMNLTSRKELVQSILADLGMDPLMLDQNFGTISGGQKQRLIIAICFSLNRSVILMDEPTASLDDKAIGLLVNATKKLLQQGITIVSASHNPLWLGEANIRYPL